MFDFLNLTTGSSGKIVAKLQGWLNELLKLKPPLELTGFFDPKTGAAVRKFQQQNNIPIGRQPVVTIKTWKLIGRKLGERRIFDDPDFPPALKKIFQPRSENGCNDTTGCIPLKNNPRNYGKPRVCPNSVKKPAQLCPAGKKTHAYFGRGYAQLTHFGNYQTLSDRLGLGDQLVHFPERANEPDISYKIMSLGMREGLFTRHKLSDYISEARCDYRSARDIINPGDQVTYVLGEELATIFEDLFEASAIN